MRHNTATFNTALLSPDIRMRFQSIFKVAERRSVVAWKESALGNAELLVVDSEPPAQLGDGPTCTIFVGPPATAHVGSQPQMKRRFQLTPEFTVNELCDTLDRAAVWLLDMRSQSDIYANEAEARPLSQDEDTQYKLRRWVTLGPNFSVHGNGYTRAAALLTRESMSLERMCEHSGLSKEHGRYLLEELERLGVLQVIDRVAETAATPSAPGNIGTGFFSKLSRWLRQNRQLPEGR